MKRADGWTEALQAIAGRLNHPVAQPVTWVAPGGTTPLQARITALEGSHAQ